jgi:LPS export ABC transporter protein LptC
MNHDVPKLRAPSGSRRRTLPLSGVSFGLAIALLFGGCGQQRSIGPSMPPSELPDQEVEDFALTETDGGKLQWKLYARVAQMYEARNRIVVNGVRVDFFDEHGQRASQLTAREGEINQMTHDMLATGNVVLQTNEGTRMSTEEMRFVNRTQKIMSDRLVRVERTGDVLTGVGFESDPDLSHFEFKRRVSATVRTRSGGVMAPKSGSR